VKLSSRDAAAKTVTVPDSFGDEEADPADEPEPEPEPDEEEQALRASSAAAPAPAAHRLRRVRRTERVITGRLPLLVREGSPEPSDTRIRRSY
jgi:hypothetical protein